MAGRPLTRAALDKLNAIGIERICETYVERRTVQNMLEALHVHPSRPLFYQWLDADPSRRIAWEAARNAIADEAAEQVREIPERVTDPSEVPLARLRVDSAKWVAENYDRSRFGRTQQNVQVELNVSSTWLVSLKGREGGADTSSDIAGARAVVGVRAGQGLLPGGEDAP